MNDPRALTLRQRLRFLAKDSLLYGGASAFSKAFSLITFPLLARYFSVQEYGVIDFFTVIATLLMTVLVFGQDSAVARYFYEYEEPHARKQVISQSLAFQLALLVVCLLPLWALAGRLAGALTDSSDATWLLKLVLLQVPFLLVINFSQNILKWTFARAPYLFVSIGSVVFSVIVLLISIVSFRVGVRGVFVIYLITRAVFAVAGLWLVRKWLEMPRDWSLMRRMLPYAVPFGVVGTVMAVMPAAERTLVTQVLGAKDLGLYAAGSKIALLISMPIGAFQVAWGPFSLAIFKEHDAERTYNWVLKAFSLGVLVCALLLMMLAAPAIHILASDRYAGASVVVVGISLAMAVQSIGWITAVGIAFSKKSYLYYPAYAAFLLVSIGAILLLVHFFGLSGVAWGSFLGYLTKMLIESWLAQRAYPLKWEYSGAISLAIVAISVGLTSQVVTSMNGALAGSVVAGLGVPVVAAVGWFVAFGPEERRRIATAAGQFRRVPAS